MVRINTERFALGFLRVNGFFSLTNFVVHPDDENQGQKTDVDVAAIRFPFREELLINPMEDHPIFTQFNKPLILIGEVKSGVNRINDSWTNLSNLNMNRIFSTIGALQKHNNDILIRNLFNSGGFQSEFYYFNLICFGREKNEELQERLPNLIQFTWEDCLIFGFERFQRYSRIKHHHPQWDDDFRPIWNLAMDSTNLEEFISQVEITSEKTFSYDNFDSNESQISQSNSETTPVVIERNHRKPEITELIIEETIRSLRRDINCLPKTIHQPIASKRGEHHRCQLFC